ncbi:DUF2092 domain-containing protein [Streptomyces sp. DSM 44915]|uniref:DUF2092 domain-containing protein n=1 Tax=Streptomyces chisholmiae TaxID=3075540 RepID=A0ABU2JRP8_9ACTN|nr:DUF2092 domain-containing protein [Streptomyces sp. DSM 44915]MDT0267607.1 DUF2092 domain-containing protein [Streptomyces sp. DSM 44915]
MALHRNIRRAGLPIAVTAGVAAIGVGVWPALASEGSPDLPEMTAEELLVLVAESDTAQLSGTVQVDNGLNIPDAGGIANRVLGDVEGPAGRLAALATGEGTLRVAVDGPDRQRLALVDGPEEFTVIHNGDQLWAYDSESNTAYQADLAGFEAAGEQPQPEAVDAWLGDLTPQEAAERLLTEAERAADVEVAGTGRVAGRDVYQLTIEPHEAVGPLASARISVDAETGVPLAVRGESTSGPTVEVAFTQVDFAPPAGGAFQFSPPADAEVLRADPAEPFGGLLDELLPEALPEGLAAPELTDELRDGLSQELTEEELAELREGLPEAELAELSDRLAEELPGLAELLDEVLR